MFETAELSCNIGKKEFVERLDELRSELIQLQSSLKKTPCPILIIVSGVDGAGKGEVVHKLNEWLDPRGLFTKAFDEPTEEERERPRYWRYWQTLPARGEIGILFGSWYTGPILKRVYGDIKQEEFDQKLRRIRLFERMLAQDGALIIKLWFHLTKEAQWKRLNDLQQNPKTHWRVCQLDWKHHKLYDKFIRSSERALRETDTELAPWHIIEATHARFRDLKVAETVVQAMKSKLEALKAAAAPSPSAAKAPPTQPVSSPTPPPENVLHHVDLTKALEPKAYREKLAHYQGELNRLTWEAAQKKVSLVLVFEGWDAGGKGGCIRRLTEAMDPRLTRVVPVGVPTDEEFAHHYLWRFWRHIPRAGRVTFFDRSWYGRVLVERVEHFATQDEWQRAYHEINDFEEQLVEHQSVVLKFWLHISKEVQLERFKKRELVPYKRHKITEEDWRNREKWGLYEEAVHDMISHTSTEYAPWILVPANNKRYARIAILKATCERLRSAIAAADKSTKS